MDLNRDVDIINEKLQVKSDKKAMDLSIEKYKKDFIAELKGGLGAEMMANPKKITIKKKNGFYIALKKFFTKF